MRLFNVKINNQQLMQMLLQSLGKKKARMEFNSNTMIRTIRPSSICTKNRWLRRNSLRTQTKMTMTMILSSLKMLRERVLSERQQSEGQWRMHLLAYMNNLKTFPKDSSGHRSRRALGIYLKDVTRMQWRQLYHWGLYSMKTSLRFLSISLTIWMTSSCSQFSISYMKSSKCNF